MKSKFLAFPTGIYEVRDTDYILKALLTRKLKNLFWQLMTIKKNIEPLHDTKNDTKSYMTLKLSR